MEKHTRGIAFKLSASVLFSSTMIFLIIIGYNYYTSRRSIIKNINAYAYSIALAGVHKIESELLAVQKVPQNLGYVLETLAPDTAKIAQMLTAVVRENEEIFGVVVALQPSLDTRYPEYYAPYCFKKGDSTILMSLTGKSNDIYYDDWYQIPFMLKRPLWSEPYYDAAGGGIVMCTYSTPVYTVNDSCKPVSGIVTADINLTWLLNVVSSIKVARTGYGFLISKNGTIITHPDTHLVLNETIFSVAEGRNDTLLRQIGRSMIRGDSGFVQTRCTGTNEECWMVYVPLRSCGWSLGVLFPKRELMADISVLNRNLLVIGCIGFLILFIITITISGTITRSLRALVKITEEISRGNLDCIIPDHETADETGDETERLAHSFKVMRDALKGQIRELTLTTSAKERIESELKIAHDIQINMLPRIYPPFPERPEIDLFAMIQPAREVGGDFFDFFFVDEQRLFFYIADVAGKGVPASLFMAVSRTLIKTKCTSGFGIDLVMARVNDDLCIDNDTCMFVTLFCGLLDMQSGKLEYVNGGHNPPLLCRKGNDFTFFPVHKGIALGVMPGVSFTAQTIDLSPGDTVFLYTDGVNEALGRTREQFGIERLMRVLNEKPDSNVRELIHKVQESIVHFTEGEEQSDDITMLALRYMGDHTLYGKK